MPNYDTVLNTNHNIYNTDNNVVWHTRKLAEKINESWIKSPSQSNFHEICWISLNKMIIFTGLDARALIQRGFLDERVKNILFSDHTSGTVSDILYNVPVILLCFDLTALTFAVGVTTIGIFYSHHWFCNVRCVEHDCCINKKCLQMEMGMVCH